MNTARSTRSSPLRLIFGLAGLLALPPSASAQTGPHIGYVYPAGGQQGTSFQVIVAGQILNGATNAYVSGAGVQAAVVEYTKPLTPKEINELRQKLKELQDKRAAARTNRTEYVPAEARVSTNAVWTAEDQSMMAEIREKIAATEKRRANPAIAETVTLRVTVAPTAELGGHELRLQTQLGLSNPLVFCVGQSPEFSERAATEIKEPAGPRRNAQTKPTRTEMNITLPATVNGQIMPGGVARYRFAARSGQHLVIAVAARELIPYLADAVPGWFQASLSLYDSGGHELACADHFRFHPDPVLYYEVPRDGDYIVEIHDSLYRGREDFVYRITIGELPFLTDVFPLGAPAGGTTTVKLTGWNLPVDSLTQLFKTAGGYTVSAHGGGRISNHVPFVVDALPECFDAETNHSPAAAQSVALPVIVNGRVAKPGDRHVYSFEGRAGEEIVAEVLARRLGSPLDSTLQLTDAAGKQLAFNDDCEDKGAGLETHHADSYLRVRLPANGTYHLFLADAQHQGGPEFAYRLRISPPRPDFELRVVPSSINVRGGASVPFTVFALRRDGFDRRITLALKNAPEGFALSGGEIPPGEDKVRLTLTAPPAAFDGLLTLDLEGQGLINGRMVSRAAVPAEDMMQAFAYQHLVPARDWMICVSDRPVAAGAPTILDAIPVRIPAGGAASVRLATPSRAYVDRFNFELNAPPDGMALTSVTPTDQGMELVLQCDAAKAKPGLRGNLIVDLVPAAKPAAAGGAKKAGNQRRAPVGTLPAIPFVVQQQVAGNPQQ
ncbi:MAG TPA: PPC domain-containing protein [Verrucomicrobiae bacterium]|nr:PPC domain-containing protein [Verrucomicrobiae bacterium]